MTREAPLLAETTPSDEDLLIALRDGPSGDGTAGAKVHSLERRPSAYRTSFALEEVTADLEGGAVLRLLLKNLGRGALHPSARRAKPAFLYEPVREVETYRAILGPRPLGTPRLYASEADPLSGRFWLLLERVPGVELYQVGDLGVWRAVARWLARFHAGALADPVLPQVARRARLIRYDAAFYRRWIDRACGFACADSSPHRGSRRRLIQLRARYDEVLEPLLALPPTLLHGEFYASNVLVDAGGGSGLRVCPVDWEMAALGPGLIDLAALVAGGWTETEKEDIARAYHSELARLGAAFSPAWPELKADLIRSRLHVAVQWLGWSNHWSPPPEHVQDWLEEALGLAERLGLCE